MTRLQRLQSGFQNYLSDAEADFTAAVVGDQRASAEQRLRVYFDAYRLRLLGVLRNDFSGLAAMLNEAEWQEMGLAYLAQHPSGNPSVRWFGHQLAGFLSVAEPWCQRPALAEMARFEWAWGRSFDAADAGQLALEELQRLAADDWPGLVFGLHPSLQRLELRSNVPAIFQAVSEQQTAPELVVAAGPVHWMLWRHELKVLWRSLAEDEASALSVAQAQGNFAAICAALNDYLPADEVPLRAVGLIQQWLVDGLLVGIEPGAAPA